MSLWRPPEPLSLEAGRKTGVPPSWAGELSPRAGAGTRAEGLDEESSDPFLRRREKYVAAVVLAAAISAALAQTAWAGGLTGDAEWLKPERRRRLAGAGEIGVNPDQRIHEDARRLTELTADLGIGLLQALVLLLCFLGVLWTVAGELHISIFGVTLQIPGYMVWCALLYAASGSWLTWRVGRPLAGLNSQRYQREADLRSALARANQQAEIAARFRDAEGEKRRLGLALGKVRGVARRIVYATAKLTWITAGYGWISIVAPVVIASPAYFSGRCSFGGLMIVVGAFYQVNQSLRWFVDNFALLAEWRAALFRVIRFREVLSMPELGCEQETSAVHLSDFANHSTPRKPASVKVLDDVA